MRRIIFITLLSALALAPAAMAQGGGSAVDEYTEQVPGAGGDRPSSEAGAGGGGSLPPGALSALEAQGADGARAAALAEATAPKGKGEKGEKGEKGGTSAGGADADSSDGGGLGEALSQIADPDGSESGGGMRLRPPRRRGGRQPGQGE